MSPFEHRGSLPSLFSDSTESSPTTTNSTFDSPLNSDISASNSPESASSLAPLSTFRSVTLSTEGQSIAALSGDKQQANMEHSQTMQDTAKNVKKLTLDMSLPMIRRPATAIGLDSSHPLSAPSSPLKEPMKSARKKPTNLTIRTPGYNQLTFPRAGGNVPATPGGRPSLHAYQSSPSLSALASPRGPPAGGMFLPLPTLNTSHSKHNSSSSNGSSFMTSSMPDLREEEAHQLQKSQEAPERGYTEGPVCIYDCGVYLYLEPTAEEASKFDTVINVAKEIRNPFKSNDAGEGTVMSVWRNNTEVPEPQTAVSEYSFKSAQEWPQPGSTASPTTPKQTTFAPQPKQPEYIHVRWDHNSEILEDLYPLCSIIDDRVSAGKKVLVHCQLGVSRSASLIIAYGLFKGYQSNFHSMYMAVKDKSRWVGPNMSLIYQLTDFKNKVQSGTFASKMAQPDPAWFVRSPEGPLTPLAPSSAPVETPSTATAKPLLPSTDTEVVPEKRTTLLRLNKALPPVPLFPKPCSNIQTVSEKAPTEPPPPPPIKPFTTVKRAASRPLPFRERNMDMTIPEHKPRHFPGITLAQSSATMDLAMRDVPSTPSLFSPRLTEFMAAPFGLRGAGDLVTPGNRKSKEIPTSFSWLPLRKEGHVRTASKDPRSPHHQDETDELFRSIDNYL
ncbi:tyrosine/serine/threonine protein phosphatase [Neophaeococcomyces mojaviensis]|uniref:Tyrosine/serine/threonine protein phosphatase n=1 Tax=Neophaeococcomyces mojaviensis TaxID=3383035 RepID=A0ACC3A6Q2_9EURO|nr:tyrosine/serine/threonine protein phosphatase [Knufia sp. JES_112]